MISIAVVFLIVNMRSTIKLFNSKHKMSISTTHLKLTMDLHYAYNISDKIYPHLIWCCVFIVNICILRKDGVERPVLIFLKVLNENLVEESFSCCNMYLKPMAVVGHNLRLKVLTVLVHSKGRGTACVFLRFVDFGLTRFSSLVMVPISGSKKTAFGSRQFED